MAQVDYMDDVSVKISKKYKPPPRINLGISYSHRLSLIKQIQERIPSYDFIAEKTALEALRERKSARASMLVSLNKRVQQSRELCAEKKGQETVLSSQPLIPTQVTGSCSSILTPTLAKFSETKECEAPEKSPFNISEFEPDTYSPFDNLELKSINDMEVLAQVLKVEGTKANFSGVPSASSLNYSSNHTSPTTANYVQYYHRIMSPQS